jgi:Domain of unknown function (DUF4169)
MAEIINLRRARRRKARGEKEKTAEANRILHGTPKSLRGLAKARTEKAARDLDAHKKD